jgi:hypothetical protein
MSLYNDWKLLEVVSCVGENARGPVSLISLFGNAARKNYAIAISFADLQGRRLAV